MAGTTHLLSSHSAVPAASLVAQLRVGQQWRARSATWTTHMPRARCFAARCFASRVACLFVRCAVRRGVVRYRPRTVPRLQRVRAGPSAVPGFAGERQRDEECEDTDEKAQQDGVLGDMPWHGAGRAADVSGPLVVRRRDSSVSVAVGVSWARRCWVGLGWRDVVVTQGKAKVEGGGAQKARVRCPPLGALNRDPAHGRVWSCVQTHTHTHLCAQCCSGVANLGS